MTACCVGWLYEYLPGCSSFRRLIDTTTQGILPLLVTSGWFLINCLCLNSKPPPSLETLEMINVRTSVDLSGDLVFGDDMLQKVHHNYLWGQASNVSNPHLILIILTRSS